MFLSMKVPKPAIMDFWSYWMWRSGISFGFSVARSRVRILVYTQALLSWWNGPVNLNSIYQKDAESISWIFVKKTRRTRVF